MQFCGVTAGPVLWLLYKVSVLQNCVFVASSAFNCAVRWRAKQRTSLRGCASRRRPARSRCSCGGSCGCGLLSKPVEWNNMLSTNLQIVHCVLDSNLRLHSIAPDASGLRVLLQLMMAQGLSGVSRIRVSVRLPLLRTHLDCESWCD